MNVAAHYPWMLLLAIVALAGRTGGAAVGGEQEGTPMAEMLPAPSAQLTLADLEQMALAQNPTLVQAGAGISASRGKALQAGLYPNPTIGYSGELIGVKNAAGQPTAGEFQGGFVQQTIVTGGKLRLSRAKYNQEAAEAGILAMGQQLVVLNGVRTRFYEVMAAQRMIELRRELLANSEENFRTTREMFNTGLANEADVLLAEIEVNRAKIASVGEENRYVALWQHLASVIGSPELAPTALQGQLEPDSSPLEWESSLCTLLQDSPELLAAHAHVVHDQILVQRERKEPIPNITVQAGPGYNFETPGTNAIVQATVEIPLFDRNQGTVRQAQAELLRSRAEVQRIELSLRQRLADVFREYRTASLAAKLYREANVPKATKAYGIQLEMYKQRRIAWLEVVKLQQNLLHVQSEYTQNLLELRKAEVAITGLLMIDGLSAPPSPLPGGHIDALPKPR